MQDHTPTTKPVNPINGAAMLVLLAGTVGLVATSSASASMTSTSMISARSTDSGGDDYSDLDDDHDDGTEGDVTDLPDTIRLTGTVRDSQERRVAGGHQDFERRPTGGFGQYVKHRTQSNFRIETTLQLRTVSLPPTAALYD